MGALAVGGGGTGAGCGVGGGGVGDASGDGAGGVPPPVDVVGVGAGGVPPLVPPLPAHMHRPAVAHGHHVCSGHGEQCASVAPCGLLGIATQSQVVVQGVGSTRAGAFGAHWHRSSAVHGHHGCPGHAAQ